MRLRFTYSALFVLAFLFSMAQENEAKTGKQTFSISKKNPTSSATQSSGRIQFSINTVKVSNDSAQRSFHIKRKDNTAPEISITSPAAKRGFKIVELEKSVMLTGKLDDESGILEVFVNGKEAQVSADGQFWISLLLAYGDNPIHISATDVHENTSVKDFVIERKTAQPPTTVNKQRTSNVITWEFPMQADQRSQEEQVTLQTCIQTADPIKEVNIFINGWKERTVTAADLSSIGNCEYHLSEDLKLQLDLNKIRVEVIGESTVFDVVRDMYYSPDVGTYHALIIAVEEYDDARINDLDEPVNDADKLYTILSEDYTFDKEHITYLKNPTKAEIFSTLQKLRTTLTGNDNLLIFYAGHGYWDQEMETGYWLPSDADQDNTVNWLSNNDLTRYINVIKTKHTLLIADACFSGGIFKTRSAFQNNTAIEKLYDMPSRKAMTSGTLKEVPDKSVFIKYLATRLKDNDDNYLTSEQLFSSMRIAVLNNSPNVPQYGTIHNVGDQGGDFIFIRR